MKPPPYGRIDKGDSGGRKRSFKEDAVFWLVAGFDHSVITIKIASEVKMRNQIKEFLSWR
jgi:hypothetical protein